MEKKTKKLGRKKKYKAEMRGFLLNLPAPMYEKIQAIAQESFPPTTMTELLQLQCAKLIRQYYPE